MSARDRPVDRQFEHEAIRAHQRDADISAERDGLLDPDQPTKTAHADWVEQMARPFTPAELTPEERMMIRTARNNP